MANEQQFRPSTPDPAMMTLVMTAIRAIMMALGVFGITWGAKIDENGLEILAGAALTIASVGLSFWQKYQAAKHAHEAAKRSADIGAPVKPVG